MTEANEPASAPAELPSLPQEDGVPAGADASRSGPPEPESDSSVSIPVPPPVQVLDIDVDKRQRLLRTARRLDVVLAGCVLVLAFLLGSFAAANSSLWLHLASGRNLAAGQYEFGVDPFSFTTADQVWVNHNWLADLLLYLLYTAAGGTGLVVAKALLVTLLAALLLRLRRPGESLWPAVVCVVLALLAMSPRLLLEPLVFSLLLLGVTMFLLFREPASTTTAGNSRPSTLWLLPPLFALWVNLDGWFLLGPLTVALVLLGEWLQGFFQGDPPVPRDRLRTLARVLAVGGVAVCLLNPHLHRALVLPAELAWLVVQSGSWLPSGTIAAGTTLQQIDLHDSTFLQTLHLWHSPLAGEYWSVPARGLNVAGLSYFVLLLLGLLSFALGGINWPRLVVWSAFAALSLAQARLIPLFAVVAGPITTLNLQDLFARRRADAQPVLMPSRLRLVGGRVAVLLACLLLLVLAWPGSLHGRISDRQGPHRVSWEVTIDPSLQRTALALDRGQRDGLRHGFNYTPEIANYCAWFAPEVKGFYDYRFELFVDKAAAVGQLRRILRDHAGAFGQANPRQRDRSLLASFQGLFQANQIDHVILTGFDRNPVVSQLVQRLWLDARAWVSLYEDGRTNVFGWKDPRQPAQARVLERLAVNLDARAFGPRQPEPGLPEGSRPFLQEPERWEEILHGPPRPSLDTDQANYYLAYYAVLAPRRQQLYHLLLGLPVDSLRDIPAWAGVAAGGAAGAGALAGPLHAQMLYLYLTGLRAQPEDLGPSAPLLLAVQAARRGVAASPTDPRGYRVLAHAYARLKEQERYWARHNGKQDLAPRETMRRLQWTAALKRLLDLEPDNAEVHRLLYETYLEQHYLDVALEHLTEFRRLLAEREPPPAQAEDFKKFRKMAEERFLALTAEVNQRRTWYDTHAIGQKPLKKFAIALLEPYRSADASPRSGERQTLGLARQALTVLQETNIAELSGEGTIASALGQLEVLLGLGEVKEVSEALENKDLKNSLGLHYLRVQAQVAAMLGDYELFDRDLGEMERKSGVLLLLKRLSALLVVQEVGFDPRAPGEALLRLGFSLQLRTDAIGPLQHLADVRFQRGLMALEHGDTAAAERHFGDVLLLTGPEVPFPDRVIAARYVRLLEEHRGP